MDKVIETNIRLKDWIDLQVDFDGIDMGDNENDIVIHYHDDEDSPLSQYIKENAYVSKKIGQHIVTNWLSMILNNHLDALIEVAKDEWIQERFTTPFDKWTKEDWEEEWYEEFGNVLKYGVGNYPKYEQRIVDAIKGNGKNE